jgi:hypothetical protein
MSFVRRLTLKLDSGLQSVDVELSTPTASGKSWMCHYDIGWPEGRSAGNVGGADALQAIYLAMQSVALDLYANPHHKAGRLYWQKPGQGYGFPMPKAGRADLVGEDRVTQV